MDSRAETLIQIGSRLFSKKRTLDSLNQEIAERFFPMRADFTRSVQLGNDFALNVMDSYPVQARETLSNLPNAVLRQGDWFSVKTGDEDTDQNPVNSVWFDKAAKDLRRIVYNRRANFISAMNEADHDWVTFGNRVSSVEESSDRTHFVYRYWHLKDCAWLENADGAVDNMHRQMKMTARNMVKKWGDKVDPQIRNCVSKEPDKEWEIRHIVIPTDEMYGDDRTSMQKYKRFPFLSLYVDVANNKVLAEGGLPCFNYVASRWRKVSPFQYGFSPATINSLPDNRMLQQLAMIILETGEKALDPPMIGKGEIFRDGLNAYAGGLTYVDLEADEKLQDVFQTIPFGNNFQIGLEMKQDIRQLISEAFLLNKINLPDTREMTAYETQQRVDEYRRAVLPFFGPYETEVHLPLLDITFQMATHAKMMSFDDMPEELQGEEITFNFESPLATAEGRTMVSAFQETFQIIGAVSQMDQSITKRYDLKKATDDAVRGTGAPADWFVDETQVEQQDQQDEQTGQLQQAAAALQQGAAVGGQVADATLKMREAGLIQ
ncbi:portal protein [Agrobacterium vitis]|uniref:portal protein n=1 Tax=Agrobacterium vitis TaxID=373 RepID=UPI00403E4CC4